tara:strand:- start:48 stop:2366 length:2319 start_codon:yes stop_codon:yes gene_type:complete
MEGNVLPSLEAVLRTVYIVLGGGVVYAFFGAPAVVTCVGVVHPLLESQKLLQLLGGGDGVASRELLRSLAKQWLTYWVLFGLFVVLETFSGVLLWLIPSYYAWKLGFLLFLISPHSEMGATQLFGALVEPILDAVESALRGDAGDAAAQGTSRGGSESESGSSADADAAGATNVSINLALVGAVCACGVLWVPRRISFWFLLALLLCASAALAAGLLWLVKGPDGAVVLNATVALQEDGALPAADAAPSDGARLTFKIARSPYVAAAAAEGGAARSSSPSPSLTRAGKSGEALGRLRLKVELVAGVHSTDVARLRGQLKTAAKALVAPLLETHPFVHPGSGEPLFEMRDVEIATVASSSSSDGDGNGDGGDDTTSSSASSSSDDAGTSTGTAALEIIVVIAARPAWWHHSSTALSYFDLTARLFVGAPPVIVVRAGASLLFCGGALSPLFHVFLTPSPPPHRAHTQHRTARGFLRAPPCSAMRSSPTSLRWTRRPRRRTAECFRSSRCCRPPSRQACARGAAPRKGGASRATGSPGCGQRFGSRRCASASFDSPRGSRWLRRSPSCKVRLELCSSLVALCASFIPFSSSLPSSLSLFLSLSLPPSPPSPLSIDLHRRFVRRDARRNVRPGFLQSTTQFVMSTLSSTVENRVSTADLKQWLSAKIATHASSGGTGTSSAALGLIRVQARKVVDRVSSVVIELPLRRTKTTVKENDDGGGGGSGGKGGGSASPKVSGTKQEISISQLETGRLTIDVERLRLLAVLLDEGVEEAK